MKQKLASAKKLEELRRLYRAPSQNRFKIKEQTSFKSYNNFKNQRPLSSRELLFSLLLTFVMITIQLLISRLI